MATVVFGNRGTSLIDDASFRALDPASGAKYESISRDSYTIRGTDGSKDVFKGQFLVYQDISGQPVLGGGTITTYERYFPDGQLAYSMSGIRLLTSQFDFLSYSMHILGDREGAIKRNWELLVNSDTITGGTGNDVFMFTYGNDTVNGGAGTDSVYLNDAVSYSIGSGVASFVRVGPKDYEVTYFGFKNTFKDVERFIFEENDHTFVIATDVSGSAGQAYRLYQAAFDRTPDTGGLGYWINAIDRGASLTDVAGGFMGSAEFQGMYGASPTSTTLVSKFYQNVLHRAPDQAGLDFWVDVLESGRGSKQQVLVEFAESPENQAAVIGVIGSGITYDYYLG